MRDQDEPHARHQGLSGRLSAYRAVPTRPSRDLVAIPNPSPGRDYEVRCQTPEFTCVCPMTGQPDFATVTLTYVPDERIVELKSLKLYLWSYRDEGAFHEDVTNRILDDLVACLAPRRMTVTTEWLVRGGIHTRVEASHP
jgi:7-cyano-7-deazaguanine reductase